MRRNLTTLAISLALLTRVASAQDAQYWTQKLGTRSLLLSGVVIGSAVDLSTTYYNPGGLAFFQEPDKVLTVKAFDFSNTKLTDGAGPGIDFGSSRSSVLPTFFGGTVPIHLFGSKNLAYSIFPHQTNQSTIAGRSGGLYDVFPTVPGNEPFAAEARLEQDVNETWVGVTWARMVGKKISVGVSPFVSVRSQTSRRQLVAQATAPSTGAGAATNQTVGFDYNQWGVLAKLGIMGKFGKVDAGLTLTTPTLKIYNKGNALLNDYEQGQDFTGDGIPDNKFVASYQNGIDGRYKTPVSIGAGLAYHLSQTSLYASGEWFAKIDEYQALDVAPITDQVTGVPDTIPVSHSARSVFNWGFGAERKLSTKTSIFASFATDQSSLPGQKSSLAFSTWDINLITAGTTFTLKKWEFTLGGGYSWGSAPAKNIPNLSNPSVNGGLVSGTIPSKVGYQSIRLIFGFSI
jgi:hypothetical protein